MKVRPNRPPQMPLAATSRRACSVWIAVRYRNCFPVTGCIRFCWVQRHVLPFQVGRQLEQISVQRSYDFLAESPAAYIFTSSANYRTVELLTHDGRPLGPDRSCRQFFRQNIEGLKEWKLPAKSEQNIEMLGKIPRQPNWTMQHNYCGKVTTIRDKIKRKALQ